MTPAEKVAFWNMGQSIGAAVRVNGRMRTTRAPAQVLSDGRAVVWLDSVMGAVDLDRVSPA